MYINVGELVLIKARQRLGIVVKKETANKSSPSLHMKHLVYPQLYYVYVDSGCIIGPLFQDELQTVKEKSLSFLIADMQRLNNIAC